MPKPPGLEPKRGTDVMPDRANPARNAFATAPESAIGNSSSRSDCLLAPGRLISALLWDARPRSTLALRLGMRVGKQGTTPEAGRLANECSALPARFCKRMTTGDCCRAVRAAKPQTQDRVLCRPRVGHA